jgi:hypothetical protein
MDSENKSVDVLGLAPFGEAINTAVEKTGDIGKLTVEKLFEWTENFFGTICQPAAAEAGLLLRDKMRAYRGKHLAAIAGYAKPLLDITLDGLQLKAPPRVVAEVIESGSWCEDEELQKMWAGLLASSATPDGTDETSTIFTDTLKRLIPAEARLLEFACLNAQKYVAKNDEVLCSVFGVSMEKIKEVSGLRDASAIRLHVGHLHTLGLIRGGGELSQEIILNYQQPNEEHVPNLTPQSLALQFYVRCKGTRKSVKEIFHVTDTKADANIPRPYAIKGGAAIMVHSDSKTALTT